MPLTQIARGVGFERAPHRRPVTVGCDHVTSEDIVELHAVVVHDHLLDFAPFAHLGAVPARECDHRRVELDPPDDRAVETA